MVEGKTTSSREGFNRREKANLLETYIVNEEEDTMTSTLNTSGGV